MNCSAQVRKSGSVAIVELSGKFSIAAGCGGVIRDTVRKLLGSGERNILLDLAGVTYLDSAAGLGELVGGYTSALRLGGQLKLLHPGGNVALVLHVTRLDRVFESYDDEATALHSFEAASGGSAGNFANGPVG